MKKLRIKPQWLLMVSAFFLAPVLLDAQEKALTIYTIKGPSGVGMIQLFETAPKAPPFTVRIETLPQADIMASKIIAGEVLIGVLPVNAAAKIASSGKKIQVAAILGNGMLSLLTADPAIKQLEDLKGKEVYCTGQGSTPEFVFRCILNAKNLDDATGPKLNFSLSYPEIAASLIAGRIQTALLPEPFASMARDGKRSLRSVVDIQKEWAALEGSNGANYPMTALVVDASFAAANPAVMKSILEAIRASNKWVVSHPREAARLVEKYDFGLRPPVIERSIPLSNYVFIPAQEARPAIETLFKVFLEQMPQSIGGKLPADSFYYRQ